MNLMRKIAVWHGVQHKVPLVLWLGLFQLGAAKHILTANVGFGFTVQMGLEGKIINLLIVITNVKVDKGRLTLKTLN